MQHAAQFSVFLVTAYGLAVVAWPATRSQRLRLLIAPVVCAAIPFTPLLIAAEHIGLRALACVLAFDLLFKMIDYTSRSTGGRIGDPGFPAFVALLVPFPLFTARRGPRLRWSRGRLSGWPATLTALAVFAVCLGLVQWASGSAAVQSSFLLDHTIKFILFVLAIESLARFLHGLERYVGYDTDPIIDHAYRSLTVDEFWRRFNTRVHAWLMSVVFYPSGGRHAPARGIALTFLASAAVHEVAFDIATSELNGYQFVFFMLQVPAVLLGRRLRRITMGSSVRRLALRGSTILWMWASSVFFFHGVDRVFPFFYASEHWLP